MNADTIDEGNYKAVNKYEYIYFLGRYVLLAFCIFVGDIIGKQMMTFVWLKF